jgi:hypothetical protein
MRRPCLRCGALSANTRCVACTRRYRQARYEHPAYRALPRPTGPCMLRISPKCTGIATARDHLDGDATNHIRANIAGSCIFCNSMKGGRRIDDL